ncbi:hypothetical protein CR513_54695, partial [Mucuna pruriens]
MQLRLRGVKHVPDVCFNMISVHMLDDGGYDNHFGYRKWKLTKAKKDMLPGLKNVELEKCSHCMASKQARVSFKKHPPLRKKLWVYTLKSKDQVLEKFKHFQALVERKLGKKVKCICSGNGGEYCGPFDVYCKEQGIRHEKTPPKTPQLNGLAERMNRTLIERVRCMLSEAKLPKHFWGEALYTVVHVINLSPAIALNTKAFVHVPKDETSKLDIKTRQCTFIGYDHDEYGYRMYDPIEKKLNGGQHNYGDQQLGDGFDVPLDDDAKEEQEMSQNENLCNATEPPPVQLRRSNRSKHVDLRYHWICDALDAMLLELTQVHTDNNGADMMTKTVPRGKFEACCEIAELAITST